MTTQDNQAYQDRRRAVLGDGAFKAALLKAMRDGQEVAVCGVVKDHRPMKSAHYETAARTTFGNSSAASCADDVWGTTPR